LGKIVGFCFCIIILLADYQSHSQVNDKDSVLVKEIIHFLCHDSLNGRLAGSAGESIAVQFIEDEFRKLDLEYFFQNGYAESFIFIDDFGEILVSRNIAAHINNKAEKTILIIAHYDHLGYGGVHSLSYTNTVLHPGADDNASGISTLLLLAGTMKKCHATNFNYLFLATGAKESGNFGSGAFVRKYGKTLNKVVLVVNLDMTGRYGQQQPAFFLCSDENTAKLFQSNQLNILLMTYKAGISHLEPGDHSPFLNAGFPVIQITTGKHPDMHTIADTPDKINAKGIIEITRFLNELFNIISHQ